MINIGYSEISKIFLGETEIASIYNGNNKVYQNVVVIPYPVLSGSYTYNGSSQTASFINYDSAVMDATGLSGTNAGQYTASFTPKKGYCWPDKSTSAYLITWNIARKSISGATITLNGTKTYNGSSQTQAVSSVIIGGLSATYSVSGNTGTNAGNYTLTCTGTGNFEGSQTKGWSIAKAAGNLTISTNSLSILGSAGQTGVFTFNKNGSDGTITVSSNNTSIVTASYSGTTVTGTLKATGSATITVSMAAGTNYTASSKTCSVSCALLLRVGGRIFYDDGGNNATYTFYDSNKNVISTQTVDGLANAYYYTVRGTKSKDRWYVYDSTLSSDKQWGYNGTFLGVTSDGIGKGKTNTNAILNRSDVPSDSIWYDIKNKRNTTYNGCNDWFIASMEEQNKLMSAGLVNWYSDQDMWSSVEYNNYAYRWYYGMGRWSYTYKTDVVYVRYFAARSF